MSFLKKGMVALLTVAFLSSTTLNVPVNNPKSSISSSLITAHATSKTADEAIAWVYSQVGNAIDYDGVYGAQCVDLIKAYYAYLGVSPVTGNGGDYTWNSLPAGWSRLQGAQPQKGDILVYTDGSYGHVGIYESDRSHFHQNLGYSDGNHQYVEHITSYAYNGFSASYWGVIRPDFASPHNHDYTYKSTITKQPTCTENGVRTYTCSCGDSYTEAIAATGHKYQVEEVDPTLESEGYSIFTCEVCGDTYEGDTVPPILIGEDSWYYTQKLPKNISDADYEIQCQNYYQKKATSSPGDDWVKGKLAQSGWEYTGDPIVTATYVETSDTLVMTDFYYYHYCGGSAGTEANYEQTSKFVHYDYIYPEYQVAVKSSGMDGEFPYFVLGWANDDSTVFCSSGTTCDGSAGSHGERSKAWYRMATYRYRQYAEYYYYSKQSDWGAEKDSTATNVTYRYRPNNTIIMGDVNSDGEFNVVDVVLLQKWLLAVPDVKLADWKAADLCEDGRLDVFDLCMMKRMLVKNS